MKKSTLRNLGIGFLASAVITGLYTTFVQGNAPVPGVELNSIFEGTSAKTESQLAEREAEVQSLVSDRESLLSEREQLDESFSVISSLEGEIASLQRDNASLTRLTGNQDETTPTNDTDNEGDESQGQELTEEATTTPEAEPDTVGSFTVESGSTSSDIAQQLESQGFIASASEFQELLDAWGLHESIQSGTYNLNSDMSIHDIASILTNGAYYYY